MRIISGALKGRILRTPHGRALRPTQGHVRQVLFDIVGESVQQARVLDLFAGVGAIGIEALSRGAAEAVFVERDPNALRCLRENLEALDLRDSGRVLAVQVSVGFKILEAEQDCFRWVFADPPYGTPPEEWIPRVTRQGPGAILAPEGSLVLETSRRQVTAEAIGPLRKYRTHHVGETDLEFYGWEGL